MFKIRLNPLLIIILLTISILVGTVLPAQSAFAANSVASSMAYVDGNGDICFTTYDRNHSGNLAYQTVGYTITRCAPGMNPTGEFVIFRRQQETASPGVHGGYSTNTYKIKHEDFFSAISGSWKEDLTNSNDNVYVKIDAIMRIVDYSAYDPSTGGFLPPAGASGDLKTGTWWPAGTSVESLIDKPSDAIYDAHHLSGPHCYIYDWTKKAALSAIFTSGYVLKHFDIYLLYRGKAKPASPHPDMLTFETGKHTPTVFTWNEAAGGKYRIDQGIPSGQSLETGLCADTWYGNYEYCLVDTGTHYFKMHYHFNLKFEREDPATGESETVPFEYQWEADVPLELRTFFAALWDANVYETCGEATVCNGAYESDQVYALEKPELGITLKMSGSNDPSHNDLDGIHATLKAEAASNNNDDTPHVDWPNGHKAWADGGESKAEGYAPDKPMEVTCDRPYESYDALMEDLKKFKENINDALEKHVFLDDAEAKVHGCFMYVIGTANGRAHGLYAKIRNDCFEVDGHQYMKEDICIAPEKGMEKESLIFPYEELERNSDVFVTPAPIDMPRYSECKNKRGHSCDYRLQGPNDRIVKIPESKRNGYYHTSIDTSYERQTLKFDSKEDNTTPFKAAGRVRALTVTYDDGQKLPYEDDQGRDEARCPNFKHVYNPSDTFAVDPVGTRGKFEESPDKVETFPGGKTSEGMYVQESILDHLCIDTPYYSAAYSGRGYKEFEPLYVHTPVIAPISIQGNPKTSQLITSQTPEGDNYDLTVKGYIKGNESRPRYDLLLDDKYTIDFDEAMHRKILGYSEEDGSQTSTTHFKDFIQRKWVCFPFDVMIENPSRPNFSTKAAKEKQFYQLGGQSLNGNKYTTWICVYDKAAGFGGPLEPITFYIPPWAGETTGDILYKVEALNSNNLNEESDDYVNDDHDEDYGDTGEDSPNGDFTVPEDGRKDGTSGNQGKETNVEKDPDDGHVNAKHVATYAIRVMVSGVLYGFTVTGSSDGSAHTTEKYNGSPITTPIAFAPQKMEKRSGTKNRLNAIQISKWGKANDKVRYVLDGQVENNWDETNTIPLCAGKSQAYSAEGYMKLGETINFTVKTISTKFAGNNSGILISPTYRYYDLNGNRNDDIQIYYIGHDGNIVRGDTNDSATSRSILQENEDKKANSTFSQAQEPDGSNEYRFFQSMNAGTLWDLLDLATGKYADSSGSLNNVSSITPAQVLANTVTAYPYQHIIKNKDFMYENYHNASLLYTAQCRNGNVFPDQSAFAEFMNGRTVCRSMRGIKLKASMRTFSGQDEELIQNIEVLRNNSLYANNSDMLAEKGGELDWPYGATYENWAKNQDSGTIDFTDKATQKKYMESMQTWYGAFSVPDKLYVCDASKFSGVSDVNSDGAHDLYDYMAEGGHLDDPDLWLEDDDVCGNLVVNFYIEAREDLDRKDIYNLEYGNMWDNEGRMVKMNVKKGPGAGDTQEISTDPGDIAVIDIQEKSHAVTLGGVIAD